MLQSKNCNQFFKNTNLALCSARVGCRWRCFQVLVSGGGAWPCLLAGVGMAWARALQPRAEMGSWGSTAMRD